MTGLETYVLGLFVNGSYEVLKNVFVGGYEKLKSIYDRGDNKELIEQIKIILEKNNDLKKKIEDLQKGGDINNYKFEEGSNPKGNFGNNGIYNENN